MSADSFPSSHRAWFLRVLNLAWPIILSSLSVPLVGLVDTAVMGQLPDPLYMAAVAIGAMIFSSVFWVFGFLRMGTTGFIAQAAGRSDTVEVSLALLRALLVAILLGLLVILLQYPVGEVAFWLMGAEEDVSASGRKYFNVRVWSAPATFINYVVLGCLIGMQRMRQALLVQLLLNLSNMLLDVLFVLWLGMDVVGVALASLLSEVLAMVLGLWLLRASILPIISPLLADHALRGPLSSELLSKLLTAAAISRLLSVNTDLFLRTMLLTAGFFFFTSQSAQFGTVVLAANTILMHMFSMVAYGLDGFAHAAEALVGGAYGAGNKNAFRQAVRSSTLLAFLMAILVSAVYAVSGSLIIEAVTDIRAVVDIAEVYLIWVILVPLVAVWSFQFDGIFIGAMQARAMRNTVGAALVVYVVLVWLTVPVWGNHALWVCMLVFLALRGAFLWLMYPGLLRNISRAPS